MMMCNLRRRHPYSLNLLTAQRADILKSDTVLPTVSGYQDKVNIRTFKSPDIECPDIEACHNIEAVQILSVLIFNH